MPQSDHAIPTDLTLATAARHLELRWPSLVHARFDRIGAFDGAGGEDGAAHRRVALVLSIHLLADDHAVFEAWLELPKGRRTILTRHPLACEMTVEGGWLHLDARHEGRRIIALSLADDDEVSYAQTDLLADAGFRGGTFDPPEVRRLEARPDAASA